MNHTKIEQKTRKGKTLNNKSQVYTATTTMQTNQQIYTASYGEKWCGMGEKRERIVGITFVGLLESWSLESQKSAIGLATVLRAVRVAVCSCFD